MNTPTEELCVAQSHRVADWLAHAARAWTDERPCDALEAIKEARDGLSGFVQFMAKRTKARARRARRGV